MSGFTKEAKVGLVVICAFIVGALFTIRIGHYSMPWHDKGYTVYSILDEISSLESNAPVRFAGVKVGRVEDISIHEGKAKITMEIKTRKGKPVSIPRDSTVSIHAPLLGESEVEIKRGILINEPVRDKEYLKGVPPTGLEQLGTQLGDVMAPLSEDVSVLVKAIRESLVDQNGQYNLKKIMENLDSTLKNTSTIMETNQHDIKEIIQNLQSTTRLINSFLENNNEKIQSTMTDAQTTTKKFVSITDKLESVASNLDQILDSRSQDIDTSLANIQELSEKMKEILDKIHSITSKIDEGEGTVSKLINDEELYGQIQESMKTMDESMKDSREVFSRFKNYRGNIGIRGEYFQEHDKFKTYFEASLVNTSKNFLLDMQVIISPFRYFYTDEFEQVNTQPQSPYKQERETLFTLQIGKRYKNMQLRAGIIESSGGLGFDYFFYKDKFTIGVESWDLNRDPYPHMKLYTDFRFYSFLLLHVGWDDMLNDTDSLFLGLGIQYP